ncbi:PDZ domain-containing protein [Paenibacillus sp. MER TA 81-3]|uniref:YlbL family protein n=1 Tax=Paenibacillus sp. MER TA 81-3 TaxID=2939573 RepID=UPI00203E11CE|nr:PDZ domain-containing protein [Paenibacillus sp. MER TA 81-3]MCM3337248.1 PDZ domain-containing protein [Paenibacillus sp. MER TA 81-3]
MREETMQHGNKPQRPRLHGWKWFFAGLLFVYVMVYMPTPYVVFTPGSAEEVKPMVSVKAGDEAEAGTFMLTTVRRTYANIAMLVWKAFDPNAEFGKKEESLRGRTEQEYVTEQMFNMSNSQLGAVLAAYNHLSIPYKLESQGVYVVSNDPKLAHNELQTNDRILEVGGLKVDEFADLLQALQGRKAGETLQVKVQRGKETKLVNATLVEIQDGNDPSKKRVGLGLYYGKKKDAVPTDRNKTVTFKESDIGGPSAGLMFTLELINRLSPGDLTQGHRIAGTGTIDLEGNVGPIGGVRHKVVAADRERAELFLVPEGNYEEAQAKLKKMNTKMKLVPVRTLQDALQAIEQLGPVK